jgi:hypothetical protein
MIDELVDMVPDFPGKTNQTRCFAHVLNLVAKLVIKQFDVPGKRSDKESDDDEILRELAEGIDIEEIETRLAHANEDLDPDNDKGWVDEFALMLGEEQADFNASVLPICTVIVKVGLRDDR